MNQNIPNKYHYLYICSQKKLRIYFPGWQSLNVMIIQIVNLDYRIYVSRFIIMIPSPIHIPRNSCFCSNKLESHSAQCNTMKLVCKLRLFITQNVFLWFIYSWNFLDSDVNKCLVERDNILQMVFFFLLIHCCI